MSQQDPLKSLFAALTLVVALAVAAPALAQAQAQAKPPDPKAQVKQPDPKTQAKPTTPAKPGAATPAKPGAATPAAAPAQTPPPPDYVIGPDDVLQVLFWREKDHSAEVVVRPDGMISLPLLNDVPVAGLTPEQLRDKVTELAKKYIEDPTVSIIVKTINSRKVFITGQVAKPGPYPLGAPTTVLQLIAMAGGLGDFADQKNIAVMRTEGGKQVRYKFNYKDVSRGKNLKQDILLKPGDTVIVP